MVSQECTQAHGYSSSSQAPPTRALLEGRSTRAHSSINVGWYGAPQVSASSFWRPHNMHIVFLNSCLFCQFVCLILKFLCSSWSTPVPRALPSCQQLAETMDRCLSFPLRLRPRLCLPACCRLIPKELRSCQEGIRSAVTQNCTPHVLRAVC